MNDEVRKSRGGSRKGDAEHVNPSEASTQHASAPAGSPGRIGPYRLLHRLGEGGMGEVYEAEQEAPVRRKVAIKLIKVGMDTKEVVARFEAERQALAVMNHPSIARVYDGGATADGHPFFAMEYVKGEPITTYCDRHRLSTRERIELFCEVCEGVQHAHQKGIIHRDLKPSNVLVRVQDRRPGPKIIDFGVAKATAQRLTEETMHTRMGALLGTPEYMSPEQAEMSGLDVDTRSDVYSLGVMLYELLVGTLPLETRELRRSGLDEIRRRIREEEPPRPSSRLSTLGEKNSGESARSRRTTAPALRKELKGDLDWITMKALEKDRTRRYDSAAALAADLRRHLADQPVLAGPPSQAYRLGKFIRRHRLGVAAAGVVLAALIGGLAAATWGMARARAAEATAKDEAATAQQVTEFLVGLFDAPSPNLARGRDVTAREVLDAGARKIEDALEDEPRVGARLMDTIGRVYLALALYDEALPLRERALEARRRMLGEDDPATLYTMNGVCWVLYRMARFGESEPLCVEAIERARATLGDKHPATLAYMSDLGFMYWETRRFAEAEPLLTRALDGRREILGEEHPATLDSKFSLGWLYNHTGRLTEAEALQTEAVNGWRRVLGEEHPSTLDAMNALAAVLVGLGRYEEAEAMHRDALETKRRVWGPDHPVVAYSTGNLAEVYRAQGRHSEAEALVRETLRIRLQSLGPNHPETMISTRLLGLLCTERGRFGEAEQLFSRYVESLSRTRSENDPTTIEGKVLLTRAYQGLDRDREAEISYAKLVEARRRADTGDAAALQRLDYNLACLAAVRDQRADALRFLTQAVDAGWASAWIEQDPDFASLRGDPDFEAIVARVEARLRGE